MSSLEIYPEAYAYEPIGQYVSDREIYSGDPRLMQDPLGQKTVRGDGNPSLHLEHSLFDEATGLIDESTGELYQPLPTKDTDIVTGEGMRIIIPGEEDNTPLALADFSDDIATKWMKANGHVWDVL